MLTPVAASSITFSANPGCGRMTGSMVAPVSSSQAFTNSVSSSMPVPPLNVAHLRAAPANGLSARAGPDTVARTKAAAAAAAKPVLGASFR